MLRNTILTALAFFGVSLSVEGQDFFAPVTLYGCRQDPGKTVLFPEGFATGSHPVLTIDGQREFPLSADCGEVRLTDPDGRTTAIPVTYVLSDCPHPRKGERFNVLCFGESTTEIRCKDPRDPSSRPRNWVQMAQELLPRNVQLRGNIGHGGWATYTYLNWPCAAKIDPHAPRSFFKPETMWYALGLATETGESFTGSRDQLDRIILTPFGKNRMDGSKALWDLVRLLGKRDGYPAFGPEEEYDGSKRQLEALNAWAEELMDNPVNEFYDRKTAAKGNHAFSLEAYLKRNHEKRPDFIVLNIGINDGDGANSLESAKECYARLVKCFGGIPAAHYVNRWPGVCDKGLWEGFKPRQYRVAGNTENLLRLQEKWREVARETPRLYELDVWHCQYPASQLDEKMTSSGLDCSKEDVHTGFMGLLTSAWQVVCWLYHMLSK